VRDVALDRAAREGRSIDEVMDEMRASIPAGRLGDPAELGALVAFLASERAAYITGATIQIDGGAIQGLL
jgi:3-oxoacyl-[acyl-carrier protein] reductase